MDRRTIFTKTAKGLMEASGKTSMLSRDLRNLLKEIDGKASVGQVNEKLDRYTEPKLLEALRKLAVDGFVKEFVISPSGASPASPPPVAQSAAPDDDDDLDFTSLGSKPAPQAVAPAPSDAARQAKAAELARAIAEASQREVAAKAKAEAEAQLKARAATEAAAKAKALAEAKAKLEAATRAKAEAEAKTKAEAAAAAAAKARADAEAKAKAEAEAKAKAEAEAKAKAEAEAKAKAEAEAKAKAEAEAKAKAEAEEKAKAEAQARAKVEAKAKAEAEALAKQEAEERARKDAEDKARREEEDRRRDEEQARLKREAEELRTKLEEERKAREASELKAQEDAVRAAREAEERIRAEVEERLRRESQEREERRSRKEAEERALLEARLEEERRAREEAERKVREEVELRAREDAERLRQEQERERLAAEEKAKREVEEKARQEEQARARREAEEKARAEAEARAREEAERQSREEAEKQARRAAEEQARLEAERKQAEDAQRRERKASEEAERAELERRAAEERAQAELRAKEAEERRAREEAAREARLREETEARARLEAELDKERKAREEAERQAREAAERMAREAAEQKARDEAERRAREEAERQNREELERRAREEAERKAREEADRQLARATGDDRSLATALAGQIAGPESTIALVREGVAVATRLGDAALVERMLVSALSLESSAVPEADAAWVRMELAVLADSSGRRAEALAFRAQAAAFLPADQARALRLELAAEYARMPELAAGAVELYERVLADDPGDRAVWEPLLELLRGLGRTEAWVSLLSRVVPLVEDAAERSALRIEQVNALLSQPSRADEVIRLLQDIINDDASQRDAARVLAELLEREGRTRDLIVLLQSEIDRAKDGRELSAISGLSLRLAALLERDGRSADALDVCRSALEWDPEHRGLLDNVRRLAEASGDPVLISEALEGLLRVERGEAAAALGRRLSALREELGDPEGGPLSHHVEPDVESARLIIEGAMQEHRKVLSEMESKALLAAFHIPVARTMVAHTPNEALLIGQQMGFPVAMKINSPDISHKSDAGGVMLNLRNAHEVRAAYQHIIDNVQLNRPDAKVEGISIEPMVAKPNGRELMIGVTTDPVFGPVITFGAGGTAVEIMGDRAVALPPLNSFLVKDLIQGTRIARMLGAFRNMAPVNMEALEDVLLRVSEMVCELPLLKEMDINPLILDENGALAADARVVVEYRQPSSDRYEHMAIYPYPTHLVSQWQLADGTDITIRPIRPEDAALVKKFVHDLSDETKYFRFMNSVQELTEGMLARLTQIDYSREMALVAVTSSQGQETELGVARYAINPDGKTCEFALVVADKITGKGLGQKLMVSLMEAARSKGLEIIEGEVLSHNHNMLKLMTRLGFTSKTSTDDAGIMKVKKSL